MSAQGRFGRVDWGVAVLLFAGIVAYLGYLPRDLGITDESNFLYEAKRIRDGEVMYRDFFQFGAPGASYAMALLFWAFGTTMATARIGTAVVHGLTAVLTYATGRALRVRPALAVLPPVAYIALCQPAWHVASWYWFGTLVMTLLVLALVRGPWASRPRWTVVPGLLTGLLIAAQHQRGLPTAAGVVALLVIDHLIDLRYGTTASWRSLATRLFSFLAGVALIDGPLLLIFVALAGSETLWNDLVRFPLENYHRLLTAPWGQVLKITSGLAAYTFPTLLTYLPAALIPACLRLLVGLYGARDRERLRMLLVLIGSGAFAALSIWHFPDFIHIGFVAGVYLVAAAEALEWALTFVRPARVAAPLGWAMALAIMAALALHLQRNAALLKEQFPYSHETAFGRVDFAEPTEPVLIDATRALLRQSPSHEIFAYANTSRPYLTTGGRNPTPFQLFYPPISGPEQTRQVLTILKEHGPPYIVACIMFMAPKDPIVRVINQDYELVDLPDTAGRIPIMLLYRRKDLPPGDTAAGGIPPPDRRPGASEGTGNAAEGVRS